jgi:hypothetical protein
MKLGGAWTKPQAGWGYRERTAIVCALAFAVVLGCAVAPARSEPLTDKNRFEKVGGPVSENIDIDKIKALLKAAKGISLVDKFELRRHITTFTEEFYKFHKGTSERTLAQLRAQFNELHRQIVSLLSPENPQLSAHFDHARGALWSAYSDREAFTSTVGREIVKDVEGEGAGLVGQRYEAPLTAGSAGSFGLLGPSTKKASKKVHRKGGVNR